MPNISKYSIRVATTALVMIAFVVAAFAQSPEKAKKVKQPGWIGVMIINVIEESSDEDAATPDEGARIERVVKKSPADSAGLKKEDVVVAFGGTAIKEVDDLTKAVSSTAPGTKTTVTIIRNGEKKTLDIIVGNAKKTEPIAIVGPSIEKFSAPRGFCEPSPGMEPQFRMFVQHGTLGMEVRELSEQLAEYFGAPEGEGVLVESVEKERAASKAGFKAGDVILRAGKRMVDEVEDIQKVLRKLSDGDKLDFEVLRKGSKKVLTVTIEKNLEGERGNSFQLWHNSPAPDMKRFNIELDHLQKNLEGQEKDLQKIFKKGFRISTDDEV